MYKVGDEIVFESCMPHKHYLSNNKRTKHDFQKGTVVRHISFRLYQIKFNKGEIIVCGERELLNAKEALTRLLDENLTAPHGRSV